METDIAINHGSSNLAAHWNLLGFSPREYDLIGLWSVLAMRGHQNSFGWFYYASKLEKHCYQGHCGKLGWVGGRLLDGRSRLEESTPSSERKKRPRLRHKGLNFRWWGRGLCSRSSVKGEEGIKMWKGVCPFKERRRLRETPLILVFLAGAPQGPRSSFVWWIDHWWFSCACLSLLLHYEPICFAHHCISSGRLIALILVGAH